VECFIYSIGRIQVPMQQEDGDKEAYATTRYVSLSIRMTEASMRECHKEFRDEFEGAFEEGRWSENDVLRFAMASSCFPEAIKGTEIEKLTKGFARKFFNFPESTLKSEVPS